ncbi:MAG: ABC transporter ATP-binding protein [Bryobacterales bacterium]|nr:ABC transporter ATP-binding protein [Acidobacteriota bacterium]MCB9386134.1 ABC transporter ATP-binding protein [Bryobacterales bacterium]
MLEARNLSKRYGVLYALRDLSFTVRPGEALGLLGPNGSGKSTTVNMLTGLLDPTSGQIFFEDKPIRNDLSAYKRRIGYVPETPNLYTYLSGREYLELIGCLREIPAAELDRKIRRLLDLFGLGADGYARISAYSKGMRQKILIAAALLDDPPLLIFDEPLSGLDVTSALVFRDLVKALTLAGKTVLYSSHALETVEKICTRVVILRKGVAVAQDSVANLRSLMQKPSLEDVFKQLAVSEDTASIASAIVATIEARA